MNEDNPGLGGMPSPTDTNKLIHAIKIFQRDINKKLEAITESLDEFRYDLIKQLDSRKIKSSCCDYEDNE